MRDFYRMGNSSGFPYVHLKASPFDVPHSPNMLPFMQACGSILGSLPHKKSPPPTDFRLSGTSSEHSILNPWCHPVLCLHTLCEIPSYPRHCSVCQTSATTRSTSCVSFAVPSVVHLRISVLPGSHHPGLSASAPFA